MLTVPWFSLVQKIALFILFTLSVPFAPVGATDKQRPLRIEDVLDTANLERVAPSADGEWLAAVVQRPARPGEVYGRAAYEVDPSRSDVWLISRRTGERRNVTHGAASAAGFWCAAWSPDGKRLAMLSSHPKGREPRGGNNVRLYVWDRGTGALSRVSDVALMTQTRYGSPLHTLDVRGGADGSTLATNCLGYDENAPFAWIDNHRLLAVTLPKGRVSALLDEYGRPFDHAAKTRRALHYGREPTVTAVGSGAERIALDQDAYGGVIQLFDLRAQTVTTIASVPTHPFQGALSLVVSPDRRRVALLAPIGVIAPERGQVIPHHIDDWQVDKRLGFVDLVADQRVRWAAVPAGARYPVELFSWSPDSRGIALRARRRFENKEATLFVASADTLKVEPWGGELAVGTPDSWPYPRDPTVFWADPDQLIVRGRDASKDRADWWLVGASAAPVNLSREMEAPPSSLSRIADGRFVVTSGGKLLALEQGTRRLMPMAGPALPADARIVWPQDWGRPNSTLIVQSGSGDERVFHQLTPGAEYRLDRFTLPAGAELLDVADDAAIWRERTRTGLFVRQTPIRGGDTRELLSLNTHLAGIDWGRTMLIDYVSSEGHPLKAGVILPPGYRDGQRYPVITWVYGGNIVRGLDSYFLNPYMPGIYNLYLYAARGYVVLIPSMPLDRGAPKNDRYGDVPNGVLPAIDRLVTLGIADPERIGVMGQSLGGYNVYALVTQTKRFKAAAAFAGFTDLVQAHGQFDPAARAYPGIEHEKSNNWSIFEAGLGLGVPPYEDQALYSRNSPLSYVHRVQTPLLLVHGEFDKRGGMTQAESFFYELYRQGKTARLLRYWGESHSLAQSPANIRNIVEETLAWFDKYLRPSGKVGADVRGRAAGR